MPHVRRPEVLKAVYHETLLRIRAGELPTDLIRSDRTLYRATDLGRFQIRPSGAIHKREANTILEIHDEYADRNRFSGNSLNPSVPSYGGLYCSLQQSALVNELLHYAKPASLLSGSKNAPSVAHELESKSIVKIRLMSVLHVADLSPHNPGARRFVENIGKSASVQQALHSAGTLGAWIWDHMFDGEDCSVARGIGLAVAHTGYRGLSASTVRQSPRAAEERGDNLVLFGHNCTCPPGLWVEEAYLFPANEKPIAVPVTFSA